MPAILTHYTFIKENRDNNDPDFDVMRLATQGPDVFFFYGFVLKKRPNRRKVILFGRYLHRANSVKPYLFLIEYAKASKLDWLYKYVNALFAHYVLDRNVHPYVYYKTGFHDDPKIQRKVFHNHHVEFEAVIDLIYSKERNTFVKPVKTIKVDKSKVKIVSKMFYELAKYVGYEGINEKTYYKAYKDMKFVQRVLYSRFGIKKTLFKIFGLRYPYCMSMPMKDKKYLKYDILNKNKNTWFDCVENIERNESFYELVAKAKDELHDIDILFEEWKDKDVDIKKLEEFINNIDHTGFEVDAKKKYYKLYLEE